MNNTENILWKRFLKYVSFDTQSDANSENVPTSRGQHLFAQYLRDELEEMGLEEIVLDDMGYLYATLPANTLHSVPTVGFIAHLDTSPDMSGANVKPSLVEKFNGEAIVLSSKDNIVLSPEDFPELLNYVGDDLVVTDGHTLLGADDKAGIVEIISAIEYLLSHPEIQHGKVRIAFNPDEEVGRGAHHFNVELFDCQWAYTVDGSAEGELEFENFNAASADFSIQGRNVHPGYAKNKMLNALRWATKIVDLIPADESPETTQGYDGFYHLIGINGGVDSASVSYIIRDHDREKFEQRISFMDSVAATMNEKYGDGVVKIEIKRQYSNMREKIEPVMHIVDVAKQAMSLAGVTPVVIPIRGGTDGAQLSFMGLPCPNIFAGGINFHSRYEFVSLQVMKKAIGTIVKIIEQIAKK